MDSDLKQALAAIGHFAVEGELRSLEPFGPGHIHASFRADFDPTRGPPSLLLQRINRHVFADPRQLMRTVEVVTAHIGRRQAARRPNDWQRRALQLVPAREGGFHYVDPSGEWWRAYVFIRGSRALATVGGESDRARRLGAAFGQFLSDLEDLANPGESIPRFHDLDRRISEFAGAVEADRVGRRAGCNREIQSLEFAAALRDELAPLRESLPARLVHNDAKLENLLFDRQTGDALCVTDLDTVMEGLALFDFGELIRSSAVDQPEDCGSELTVEIDWNTVAELASGFLAAAPSLSEAERRSLWLGPLVMTYENALRFLTDHLEGDPYFRVLRNRHNLERCRAQLARLDALNRGRNRLAEIVASVR